MSNNVRINGTFGMLVMVLIELMAFFNLTITLSYAGWVLLLS
jgi:hypothetical protein